MRRSGSHDDEDSAAKRRKVRKGTRSCWECRRRKIRCTYREGDGTICDGCRARKTKCVSQHFDEAGSPDSELADSPLAQRLSRVEDLLERLANQVLPGGVQQHDNGTTVTSSPTAHDSPQLPHCLQPGRASIDDAVGCINDGVGPLSSVPSFCTPGVATAQDNRHGDISKRLYTVYPSDPEIKEMVQAHETMPGIYHFFAPYELSAVEDIGAVLMADSRAGPHRHPVLVARSLVRIAHMYRQAIMNRIRPMPEDKVYDRKAAAIITLVTQLVTSNDDLVGSLEGLDTICLVALFHANCGNLRKAWLGFRRAITIAQLLGLDRHKNTPVPSIESDATSFPQPSAEDAWFRLNFSDRVNSMLLGLPAANDDAFLPGSISGEAMPATANLERVHCAVASKIIKRNYTKAPMSLSEIQSIEADLTSAARAMDSEWWTAPSKRVTAGSPAEQMKIIVHAMMQVNHHHTLILLHLPFMIKNVKDRRWESSKTTCLKSCRELLTLFKFFRLEYDGAAVCRHTDYTALTAAMTLLLGYLDPRMRSDDMATTQQRDTDRQLICDIRQVMFQLSETKADKLSLEAYRIIGRLIPLAEVERTGEADSDMDVSLDIPYLGTINIKPVVRNPRNQTTKTTASQVPVQQESTPPQHLNLHPNPPVSSTVAPEAPKEPTWDFLTPPGSTDADSMLQLTAEDGFYSVPEFSADMDQWTLQGYDAAFFESFMNNDPMVNTAVGPVTFN